MNCSNCGTPLPSGAKACPNCGTPAPAYYANVGGPESNPVAPTQYAPQQGASTGYGGSEGYEPTQRADPYASQQGNGSSYFASPPPPQPSQQSQFGQQGQSGSGSSYFAPPPPTPPGQSGQQGPSSQPGQFGSGAGYYSQPGQQWQPGQQSQPGLPGQQWQQGQPGYYGQPPVPQGTQEPQGPQGQQGGRRRRSPALLIALIAIILVLILGGAGIFYFVNAHNTQVLHANATATANAAQQAQAAQGTQAAHTTATAGVQATATAAVMNPYTQSGTLAFSDPLTANNQGQQWDENGNCAFKNGTYHVIAPDPNRSDYCIANATNFTDFALEVNMNIVNGDAGAIVFRVENTNPNMYYKFVVATDGSYILLSDNADKINILFQGSNTTAINTGVNQTNLIAIVAQGSKITAYSNHQVLDSVTDSTFNHGQIGVDATVLGHVTEVAFSNMRVWKL